MNLGGAFGVPQAGTRRCLRVLMEYYECGAQSPLGEQRL